MTAARMRWPTSWSRMPPVTACAPGRTACIRAGRRTRHPNLLALCQQVYTAQFGQPASLQVIHAGLECGLLAASHPQLDMISFGPDIRGAHAPGERVEIESVAALLAVAQGGVAGAGNKIRRLFRIIATNHFMLNSLMQGLRAWSHWGCERVESHSLRRKIFHVNVAALIAIFSMALFAVPNVLTGNPALIKSNLAQIPFYFLALAVPWLNRYGHAGMARWLLSLSVTAAIATNIWVANGSWLDLHFYFILFALLGVLFFPLRQWASIVFLFTVNASLFVYCGYFGVEPDPALLSLDATTTAMFRAAYVSSSLFTLLFITWLGEYVANKNERELEELSGMDMLTHLPNRRRLEQRLAETIAVSKRTGQRGAVMFLDLDNFKPLNDAYGHAAGDTLLQEVAQRISACIREMDMVARFGGDEFVILLGELGQEREDAQWRAAQVAEKIRVTLAEPYRIALHAGQDAGEQVEHRCTASIGVVMFAGGTMREDRHPETRRRRHVQGERERTQCDQLP